MDSELRAQTLRVIEAYKTKKSTNAGASTREIWADEVVPAMMKSMSEFIVAYDNNELSPTLQRELFRNMKKLVTNY
jgi:hypothetical protein